MKPLIRRHFNPDILRGKRHHHKGIIKATGGPCTECHIHNCTGCGGWFYCQAEHPAPPDGAIFSDYCPACSGDPASPRVGSCAICRTGMYGYPHYRGATSGKLYCARCSWDLDPKRLTLFIVCNCNGCRGRAVPYEAQ